MRDAAEEDQVVTTAEDKEAPEAAPETTDGPLLDMSDAAVKRMIKLAKQRGYVTYDELNDVLPSEEVSSEQIEDTMAMLTEMGINVVESEVDRRAGRPHRRSRPHVSARDGLRRAAVARRRDRHRQAHRGRPRGDDRRACARAR
jgi:RNA polymerase primary sigma factor